MCTNKLSFKILLLGLICIIMFSFHLWMAYPGLMNISDTSNSLVLSKSGWQPISVSLQLEFLYYLFGPHAYFLLLMNLVPFYLGLFIITFALLKKYNSWICFLALCPAFISNLFFGNFILTTRYSSAMYIWLYYTLVFYWVMTYRTTRKRRYGLNFILVIMYVLATLSRHNAFIQTLPTCLIFASILSTMYHSKKTFYLFGTGATVFTLILLLLCRGPIRPYYHILCHQIIGMHVNETTSLPPSLRHGHQWTELKTFYEKGRQLADGCPVYDYTLTEYLNALIHHPLGYLKTIHIFLRGNLKLKPVIMPVQSLQRRFLDLTFNYQQQSDDTFQIYNMMDIGELQITYTPIQEKIYRALERILPPISTFIFIYFNFLIAFINAFYFFKKQRSSLLFFTFYIAMGGVGGYIIYSVFSPTLIYGYMHPLLISCLISVIGMICYLYEAKWQHIETSSKSAEQPT